MVTSTASVDKPAVLLVEDDADVAEALSLALETMGFEVHVCHDGPEALKKAPGISPFAAIVDIGLPQGMDGYEVGQMLRMNLGPKLRLFALTGFSGDGDKNKASVASFDAYMVKPVDLDKLAAWLKADAVVWSPSGGSGAARL